MKTIFSFLLCLGLATAVTADVKLVQKVKSGPIMGQPAKDSTVTMFIKGTKARSETAASKTYQLIDLDAQKIYVVDPDKKVVLVMTTAMMKQTAGLMGQLAGNQEAKPVVEKPGTTHTYNGYKCEDVKVSMPGMMNFTSTACVTTAIQVKEFEPFKEFSEVFSKALGVDSTGGIPGFPVHTETRMSVMGQNMDSTTDLVSITREPLDASMFVVPPDYKIQEMKMPSPKEQ